MKKMELNYYKICMFSGLLLIGLGLMLPFITQTAWFDIVYKIRKAIHVGDSGHLILASASMGFLYALQSTLLFLGVLLVTYFTEVSTKLEKIKTSILFAVSIILLHAVSAWISDFPWEHVSTLLAAFISFIIFMRMYREAMHFLQISIVSIQIFFAFQWLNIMPLFSAYQIGYSDIPASIKLAGVYLQADSVLNFTGFAFFLPFIFSAFITNTLFTSYSQNIKMMKENYEKESEIQYMKSKILEDRIYKEVKSLVHDLKTPLVTIRGLNSLLAVSKDPEKLEEYSGRIDNSVGKMSEMISSFLYETSRQRLRAVELISYIRAQLPLEDETIKIQIIIGQELPDIYVNKIRMARAVINILENAIIVPTKYAFKQIVFEAKEEDAGLQIIVQDNGIGIKDSDLEHIWEVGFSTNKTSGLGLPFAKQIIDDNEGSIDIVSEPDKGTIVTIFLPAFETVKEDIHVE